MTEERIALVERLTALAAARGQTLAQMALAWVLRHPGMSSVLIGASRVSQIEDAVGALGRLAFEAGELAAIDGIVGGAETASVTR